jgi:hypothetical protein
MTEFRMPPHGGRNHRGCGGEIICVYEGRGKWYGVCSVCESEAKACDACRGLDYPDPAIVIASVPESLIAVSQTRMLEGGETEIIYECGVCQCLRFGPETLYRAIEHLEFAHDLAKFRAEIEE